MLIYHDLHSSRHRPPSLSKKSPRSSASSPFHHPLPQLRPSQQHSLSPPKIRAPRLPSKNSGRCMFGFPFKLFPALFQVHVPKTIKWPSLLSQFSGAAIRILAPGAAIRLPVRPPSDWSQWILPGAHHPSLPKVCSLGRICKLHPNLSNP